MVLKYSVALELGKSRQAGTPDASARACFDRTVAFLQQMRIAAQLPPSDSVLRLYEQCRASLDGTQNLRLEWAAERSPTRGEQWALRVEHLGADDERLLWTIDVSCIDRTAEGLPTKLGVRLSLTALDGGTRPFEVSISRPNLVYDILCAWHASWSGLPLNSSFWHWSRVRRLRSHLANPSRTLPIVIAGPSTMHDPASTRLRQGYEKLWRLVGGSAMLVALSTPEDVNSFNAGLDYSLAFDGDVECALYWPIEQGSLARQLATRRQYFKLADANGFSDFARQVFSVIAERGTLHDPGALTFVEQIESRSKSVVAARIEATATKQQEEIAELERSVAAKELEIRRMQIDLAETRNELGKQIALQSIPAKAAERAQRQLTWRELGMWTPSSVLEAVTIAQACPELQGRLVFSPAAPKGAKKSRFDDPSRALEILAFIGTEFLDGVRGGDIADLERFASESGFELAMSEGKQTHNNRTLMKLRDVVINGQEFRCEAHFKDGRGGTDSQFRVYFCIDRTGQVARIIIGHVGPHLETDGTRRM